MSKQKKGAVAVVAHGGLTPFVDGRYVPALIDLVTGLAAEWDINVVTLDYPGEISPTDFAITSIPKPHRTWRTIRALSQAVIQQHQRHPFQMVHGIWGYPGGVAAVIAARKLGLPSLVTFNGFETVGLQDIGYGGLLSWRSRTMINWVKRRATHLHFPSEYQKSLATQIDDSLATVIPYGVDPNRFSRKESVPHDPLQLLAVGSVNEVKDYDTLIAAYLEIKKEIPCKLRIVGSINSRFISVTEPSSLDIEIIGDIHPQRMPDQYHWADLLLHASRHESQGLVFLEAAASGLCIASTNVGLIHDWDKIPAVPVADPKALARLAIDLLTDHELHARCQEAFLSYSADLNLRQTRNRFSQLYQMLIDARARNPQAAGK